MTYNCELRNGGKVYHPATASTAGATISYPDTICAAPRSARALKEKLSVWPKVATTTGTSSHPSTVSIYKTSQDTSHKLKKITLKGKAARSSPDVILKGRDEELTKELNFNSSLSKAHQLGRRIPFGNALPAVENTPVANLARMTQILSSAQTQTFFASGGYSNSFTLVTTADQQIGTTMGGLGGCTILVSYTRDVLYFSHHWEYPGFNKNEKEGYPKVMFDEEVLGFLTGAPNNNGDGLPLIAPGVTIAAQPMHGASTYLITPGASGGFKAANYRAKIATIAGLTTTGLQGTSTTFPYMRPDVSQDVVSVTAEFCAANRHLRIMISDYRSGEKGGVRVVDRTI